MGMRASSRALVAFAAVAALDIAVIDEAQPEVTMFAGVDPAAMTEAALEALVGTPWDPAAVEALAEEAPVPGPALPGVPAAALPDGDEAEDATLPQPAKRGPYLTRARVRRFGYPEGCPGCDAVRASAPAPRVHRGPEWRFGVSALHGAVGASRWPKRDPAP